MPIQILPMRPFTREEILPILDGYETGEVYAFEKTETGDEIHFHFRLSPLAEPLRADFVDDFRPDEFARYLGLLEQSSAFAAYEGDRLIGFAIGEVMPEEKELRVWEFHIHPDFRRMGVGRALMERVFARAKEAGAAMVKLETQNTNVRAVRFYRRMGFRVDAVDISAYHYWAGDAEKAAFYMKKRVE